MMELLDQYFEIQSKIYEYFGYEENWRVIPLDDCRSFYWWLNEHEVYFADTEEELESESGQFFTNEIYMQRFLSKWVYEGPEYTMIVVDTHVDGNKFMQVFDNAKRRQPGAKEAIIDGQPEGASDG